MNQIYEEAPDTDPESLAPRLNEIAELVEGSSGISPYLEVYASQAEDIAARRTVGQGIYLFAGSLIGAFAFALGMLFPERSA